MLCSNMYALDMLDTTLHETRMREDDQRQFGGLVVDFVCFLFQVLLLKGKASCEKIVSGCLKKSHIWHYFKKIEVDRKYGCTRYINMSQNWQHMCHFHSVFLNLVEL